MRPDHSYLRVFLIVACSAVFCAPAVVADSVVPGPDVTTRVIVRASASSQSPQVGSLPLGQSAEFIGTVPYWYEVRLPNGVQGFVSKRWTQVVQSAQPATSPVPPSASAAFTVDVLDVGTGLAVLVRGPDFVLVYDGGSNDDTAKEPTNRMVAYITAIDPTLASIDHIILSHPHTDHVELLPDVIAKYSVKDVWDSGAINNICGYRAFIAAVHNKAGVRYHNALHNGGTQTIHFEKKDSGCYGGPAPATDVTMSLASGINNDPITLGQNATMTILHADGGHHDGFNENSIVVRLDLGTTRVLLMGDAEAGNRAIPSVLPTSGSTEGVLLNCCVSDVAAQVMIVGHHGSMTSSRKAFLDAVSPSFFVVSAGPRKYATKVLPDPEVISELSGRGQVFRTDMNDSGCRTSASKVGAPADGQPGGCDAVRVTIPLSGAPQVAVFHP